MTLSTFLDVAWSAPYYHGMGFRVLDEGQLTPGLVDLRREEVAHGLDTSRRAFMRRDG